MINKIILLILALVFAGMFYVVAEEIISDVSLTLGSSDVSGRNVLVENLEGGNIRFTFNNPLSELSVGKFSFSGIQTQADAGHPTFLELDKDGNILKGDFTTLKGGDYVFSGTQVSAPQNSRILFDKSSGVNLDVKTGETVSSFPSKIQGEGLKEHLTTIQGKDIFLPDNFLMNGKLNYLGGRSYLNLIEGTSINKVVVSDKLGEVQSTLLKDADIYFDGNSHGKVDVSFGKDKIVAESSSINGPILKFGKDNPYLDFEEKTSVEMQPSNSKIEVQNRKTENKVPKVSTKGDAVIVQGSKSLEFQNKKVYLSRKKFSDATSSPAEISARDSTGTALIRGDSIFFDNSNKMAVVSKDKISTASASGIDENTRVRYNYIGNNFVKNVWGKIVAKFRGREDYNGIELGYVAGIKG